MAIKPTVSEIKNARVTLVVKKLGESTTYEYTIQKGDTKVKITSPDKMELVYNDELNLNIVKINQNLNEFKDEE